MNSLTYLHVNGISKLGDLGRSNYTEIEFDGSLHMHGNATVWDDLLPSSVAVGTTGSNVPSFTAYTGNLKAYEFVGASSMKEINLSYQFSHSYFQGTDVEPHAHIYIPADGTGGVIKLGLEYSWVNKDALGSISTTTAYAYIIRTSADVINNNYLVSFGNVIGTGMQISSLFDCRFFRNPADSEDTFGSSIWLKSADIHYQKDTIGSRQIYTK